MPRGNNNPTFKNFYKSLVNYHQTFLSNVIAKVYRYEEDIRPDGSIIRFWSSWPDSLESLNKSIEEENKLIKQETSDGQIKKLLTPELFADHLLSTFGYEGMQWDVKSEFFDDKFTEDEEKEVIETRWDIPDIESAQKIQKAAETSLGLFSKLAHTFKLTNLTIDFKLFQEHVLTSLFDSQPKWIPRQIKWTYFWDLDKVKHKTWLYSQGIFKLNEVPIDPSAYMPFSMALKLIDRKKDFKFMQKILKKCPWIKSRKKTSNRSKVYAGDWIKFCSLYKTIGPNIDAFDTLDCEPDEKTRNELKKRTEEIDKEKKRQTSILN